MNRISIAAGALLVVLLFCLAAVHATPVQADSPACFDELLLQWNQFANEANKHVQLRDVNERRHGKQHDRLDKEWAALHALACW